MIGNVAIDQKWISSEMIIRDFERIVRTERSAMRYIEQFCRRSGRLRCPHCDNSRIYRIESGKRLRCSSCEYTFHLLTGRWLNKVKIKIHDWMWLIKLFELEAPASRIASETGLSYPTVLRAVDTIRMSIGRSDGPSSGRGGAAISSVNPEGSISQDLSLTSMRCRPYIDPESVIYASRIEEGYLILTEKNVGHKSLRIDGQAVGIVDYGKNFPHFRIYCNQKGYWPLAKERLAKHHGVSHDKLWLYLKESEFRWRNRSSPLLETLIERMCRYVSRDAEQKESYNVAI